MNNNNAITQDTTQTQKDPQTQRKQLPLCTEWTGHESGCYLSHEMVMKLIAEGKADLPNRNGQTPIQVAVDIESVKALINAGVNLNPEIIDMNGEAHSLITEAIGLTRQMNYDDGRVQLLLDSGARSIEPSGEVSKGHDAHNTNILILGISDLMIAWTLDQVKALVEHGANVNAKTILGITPLFAALISDDLKDSKAIAMYLIEHGADVNAQMANGYLGYRQTTWSLAPDEEVVNLMLSKGAKVRDIPTDQLKFTHVNAGKMRALINAGFDVHTQYHLSPLAQAEDVETAKLLLEAGMDVNDASASGHTPIKYLVATHRDDVAKYLIDAGANIAPDEDGKTLLMANPSLEMAKYLVSKGIDVNAKDSNNHTALDRVENSQVATYLIESGAILEKDKAYARLWEIADAKLAETLIQKGVNINQCAEYNDPPIKLTNNPEVVNLLIKAGADVNMKSKRDGSTPIMREISNDEIGKKLLEMGYQPQKVQEMLSKENSDKIDSVVEAIQLIQADNRKIIKLLIDAGADVNISIRNGKTALTSTSDTETVKMLIAAGANPNGAKRSSGTDTADEDNNNIKELPLITSATNADSIKLLLEAGADPSAETDNANTPLLAVFSSSLEIEMKRKIAQILIDAGADINYKTKNSSGSAGTYSYPFVERPGSTIFNILADKSKYGGYSEALQAMKLAIELGATVDCEYFEQNHTDYEHINDFLKQYCAKSDINK